MQGVIKNHISYQVTCKLVLNCLSHYKILKLNGYFNESLLFVYPSRVTFPTGLFDIYKSKENRDIDLYVNNVFIEKLCN